MKLEVSGWLLLPLLLSILYGYTQSRMESFTKMPPRVNWLTVTVITGMLSVVWAAVGFLLPVFYLLTYLMHAMRVLASGSARMENWFLLNLSYTNSVALHLIVIGAAALVQDTAMYTLLEQPLWRTMSISIVLLFHVLHNFYRLWRPSAMGLLVAEADSEEVSAFTTFLWFCVIYLLLDSTLCVLQIKSAYAPLFAVGSSMVLIFTQGRFLKHITTLLNNNYLEEEHDRLASRLLEVEESTGTLQQLAERDVLTGAHSRWYMIERMRALVDAATPFAVAYLDVDALKHVNDTQGHQAGDAYLFRISQALEGRIRQNDLLGRLGGDEFIVLMPGCTAEAADKRMQEIRGAIERERSGMTVLRFSYGVAAVSAGEKQVGALIREADQAMYHDKAQRRRGRGRL